MTAGCEGHYNDDAALTSGVGIGEVRYCNGSCQPISIGFATRLVMQWLNSDRVLNELASGVVYNDGNKYEFGDLKAWVSEIIFDPAGPQFLIDRGVNARPAGRIRDYLSEEDFEEVDWDHIRDQLTGV